MDLSELEKIQKAIPEFQYGAVFYSNGLIIQSVFKPDSNVKKIGSALSELIKKFKGFLEEIEDEPTEYKRMVFHAGELTIVILKIGEDANTILVFSKLSKPINKILHTIRQDLMCLSKLSDVPLATIEKSKIEDKKERLQREKEELEKKKSCLNEEFQTLDERSEFRMELRDDLEESVEKIQGKIEKITEQLAMVIDINEDLSGKETLTAREKVLTELVSAEQKRLEKRLGVLESRLTEDDQYKEKMLVKLTKEEKADERKREEYEEEKERLEQLKAKIEEEEEELHEKEEEVIEAEKEIQEMIKKVDKD